MTPAGEAVQVALEVEASGALGVVDQVVPVVRAGEDDGAAFGVLEEVGVVGMDAEGRHRGEGSTGLDARLFSDVPWELPFPHLEEVVSPSQI